VNAAKVTGTGKSPVLSDQSGKNNRTLNSILQLPDISRPVVAAKHPQRIISKSLYAETVLIIELFYEMLCKFRYVILSLSKRRKVNVDNIEAIIKVSLNSPYLPLPQDPCWW
jgi:hypothetical protein